MRIGLGVLDARYKRLLALLTLGAGSGSSGTGDLWTDFGPGSVINLSSATPFASFDSSGNQSTANLPANPANGQMQTIRVSGTMSSPLIVNAVGAGVTVELLNDLGTYGASTWLPIQGQVVTFKFDGTASAWKIVAQSMPGVPGDPSYNPGWYAQALIVVDPQNPLAKDSNAGTSSAAPLRNYREAARRWGGINVSFGAVVPIVEFLSSHTDNSDPVFLRATAPGTVPPIIQAAAGTIIASGVLAGVTPKNRTAGANSSLIATLPAGAAVGMQVINTTVGPRFGSRCYVKKNVAGNSWELSQPFAPQTVPTAASPTEVDGWANLDTVNVVSQIQVNVVLGEFASSELDAGFDNNLTLYNLTVLDPLSVGQDWLFANAGVSIVECAVQRTITNRTVGFNGGAGLFVSNVAMLGGFSFVSANVNIAGGFVLLFGLIVGGQGALDGDFAIEAATEIRGGTWFIGLLWMGANFVIRPAYLDFSAQFYATHVIYGRAGAIMALDGSSYGFMSSGTFAAGWTAPSLVTGVSMNGGTTAQTHTNASPDVVTSNVTTSVANADAATGGTMRTWGGATISKSP